MRTRLSLEIFGAFFLASLVLVLLTVGGLRYFSYVGFRDYLQEKDLQRLPYVGQVLEREYAREQGWHRLQQDDEAWEALMDEARERQREKGSRESNSRRKRRFPDWLFLLDRDRQPLVGERGEEKPESLMELRVDGETVGWLGLNRRALNWSPLEVAFLQKQYRMYYVLGGGILLLTFLLTVLLSRRLLVPVRTLIRGTRALASRRFDTRIRVRSRNELGRLAEDFNRMAETLETYETLRRDWISDISHELRTPLSILRGEIQALQDGVRTLDLEALDSLGAEVYRLSRLVEALHFLSLADSAGLALRRERIEPVRILRERIDAFLEAMNRKGIDVRFDPGECRHAVVIGDEDQLGRVFTNLLQNTLQYTDAPGTLRVRVTRKAGRLVITFEDSAPGVPEEALGRLFERLFRVDKSRSRALGGSGLGLSIARRIVEIHGGGMRAEHAASGGLNMSITLPLEEGAR